MKRKHVFTGDFETSTPEWYEIDGCARVWAFSLCEIGNEENFIYGNSIDMFFKWCSNPSINYTIYFHNLKFDQEYMVHYLLDNGYEFIKDTKDKKSKSFTMLISDTGAYYSMEIFFDIKGKRTNKVTIYDSLKILNFSVDKIANDFNLGENKLNLDYNRYRPVGYELQNYEIRYIKNDVLIMARALKIMFDKGLEKMTIASDALDNYKKGIRGFNRYYPVLDYEVDEVIRKSYRGGWTYLNPLYKERDVGEGIVIDKNSMYPSMMYNEFLPIGDPIYFEGKYEENICYPLYVQVFSCSFKLKEHKLPTIQLKNNFRYGSNEYIESSHGIIETLTLTSVDLELFFENYDVEDLTYQRGFMFRQIKGLFCNYIDYWMNEKIEASKEKNGARRAIAKLMLNSLYGKFGLNPNVRGKYPSLEEECVTTHMLPMETRDSIYVPVAAFITAYARRDIIHNSQAIRDYTLKTYGKDYYIYSDTDSIHCLKLSEEELSKIMNIDDYALGAYKKESEFIKAKFIRQKCYVEVGSDGELNATIAGMPKKLAKYVTLDNFKPGFSVKANDPMFKDYKLTYKHVKGGVLLVPVDFTIKG